MFFRSYGRQRGTNVIITATYACFGTTFVSVLLSGIQTTFLCLYMISAISCWVHKYQIYTPLVSSFVLRLA
jgi:hypothetical protein